MECPRCRHPNREGARFCGECGASLATTVDCPSCNAQNPPSQNFCDACGEPLTQSPQPARNPRSYTPRHLVEKVLVTRSALEGEKKQVTVLFADLADSMLLAEKVGAEEWHRILDRFFQMAEGGQGGLGLGLYIAREIVAAHGGTIEARSTVGEGTTMVIRLPLQSAALPVAGDRAMSAP